MAISIASLPVQLAGKVSEETLKHSCAILVADEDTRRGPIQIMYDLQADLGDELDAFPQIDSENEEGKAPITNNPDWSKVQTQSGSTTRDVRTSWINTFIDATTSGHEVKLYTRPELVGGHEIEAFIDLYSGIIKDKATTGPQAKDAKLELGYWQGRKATLRKVYRRAIKLHQYIEQVETQSGGKIVVEIKKDSDGSPSSSKVPILLSSKANPSDYWLGSVSSFLNMDLELAHANGGTVSDYSKTLGKGTNTADVKLTPPLKASDLERTAMAVAKLLDTDNIKTVISRMAKEKDTGDVFAWIMVECSRSMTAAVVDLYPQWEKVEAERAAELQKQRDAQAAKRKSAA